MQVLTAVNTPGGVAAGLFADERHAGASTPAIRALIQHARARPDRPVVHSNDAHHGDERESTPPKRHDGAFVHGPRVTMPEDAVCVLDGVDRATALDDPRRGYGATITAGAAPTGAGVDRAEAGQ